MSAQSQSRLETARGWSVPVLLGVITVIAMVSLWVLNDTRDTVKALVTKFDRLEDRVRANESSNIRQDTILEQRGLDRPSRAVLP